MTDFVYNNYKESSFNIRRINISKFPKKIQEKEEIFLEKIKTDILKQDWINLELKLRE